MIVYILKQIIKFIFSLRYQVEVEGLDKIDVKKGILILPNHPAEMDPVANVLWFWNKLKPRVIVIEDFYKIPFLNKIFRMIKAMPIPNMETGKGTLKVRRLEENLQQMVEGLRHGDNFIIYPSGRLSRNGTEKLGGASATKSIVDQIPDVNILMVHTDGFWGSSFSWIYANKSPDLFKQLLHGIKVILSHGIFFVAKRKIKITVELNPVDFPRQSARNELNYWIEKWHAKFGEPVLQLVTYNRLTGKLPEVELIPIGGVQDVSEVPVAFQNEVIAKIAKQHNITASEITCEQDLRYDLGFDSLELAGILAMLSEDYGASDVAIPDIDTVGAVIKLAVGSTAKEKEEQAVAPEAWSQNQSVIGLEKGTSIIESFLRKARRNPKSPMAADDLSGVLSFGEARLRVVLIAHILKKLPHARIGVMLPSLVATDIIILAIQLAGKVPVMINWTLGASNLKHVIDTADLKLILTSERFVENLENVPIDVIEEYLGYLEKIVKKELNLVLKIRSLVDSKLPTSILMKKFGLKIKADDPAVILFTSGSEAKPKGVPLSHRNILTQIDSASKILNFEHQDVFYAFLPPFHSFGLTVTTFIPILLGLRVAHYPNPTEARKLSLGIAKWSATILAGTPTFFNAIIKSAKGNQLASVKYMVTGAEKAPQELFDRAAAANPNMKVLEGYGITECSPVVAVCRPLESNSGVGKAMPGVEVIIVNLDTLAPLPQGQRGIILVRGDSVFNGYFGDSAPNPFCTVNGAEWYNTGDLGFIDAEGSIFISGRLKRFVKIGGEMISLPAIESVLQRRWPTNQDGLQIAIQAVDIDGQRPIICLFSPTEIDVSTANQFLRDNGFANIVKITKSIKVPSIPILGTGKVDYQTLKSILADNL